MLCEVTGLPEPRAVCGLIGPLDTEMVSSVKQVSGEQAAQYCALMSTLIASVCYLNLLNG